MAHRVMEFHDAVGNHETQAGRQLGSEELLLREPQRWASHVKASLSYTCYTGGRCGMGRYEKRRGHKGARVGAGVLCPIVELDSSGVGRRRGPVPGVG